MPPFAYFKGKFMPLSEAKIGIMTHALHYGTAVFEGIRGNWNEEEEQIYIFRLREHYERLVESCKLIRIKLPYTVEEMMDITCELVERSGFREDVYIRPFAYKCSEVIGPKLHGLEDDFFISVTTFPPYLDVEKGVRAMVSTWRRMDDSIAPPRGKITGIYINSCFAKTEAVEKGFDEAILLTLDGHVSEGSGQNIFIVYKGKLLTPPPWDNILIGITRDTVLKLARNELGIETEERSIDRSELYLAEEAFFTGTASHITPILEIDNFKVGTGQIGPITRQLMKLYFEIIRGKNPKYKMWCTPALRRVKV